MKVNDEGGLVFTAEETACLAAYIAAKHISDDYSGPEWEDYPALAEGQWSLVVDALNDIAKRLIRQALAAYPHVDGVELMQGS